MSDDKETASGQPPEEPDNVRAPSPIDPVTGQHKDYWVLTIEQRNRGFIRPLRRKYEHDTCKTTTIMSIGIAETYACKPTFYASTFCYECSAHFPVAEFTWCGSQERVGT